MPDLNTKKITLVMLMALLALFNTSCEKAKQLLTFHINHDENIYISATPPLIGLINLPLVPVTTNSSETFRNNKTRADLVKDVSLEKLVLTITDPQGQNFDFLQSIEIFIALENGSEETLLAHLHQVPQGATTLELLSSNAKLDKYIKADKYTIRTKATLKSALSRDTTIKAAMRFKVTADPL